MQPTPAGWPTQFDESSPTSTVEVDGAGEARDWSVARQVGGFLPEQVRGVAGLSIASGSVDLVPDDVQVDRPLSPFQAIPDTPELQTPVTISAGYDDAEVPIFTGTAHANAGESLDSATNVDIQDNASLLRKLITLLPVATSMYTRDSTITNAMYLTALWALDACARKAGFESTPNPLINTFPINGYVDVDLHVPMQGGRNPLPGSGFHRSNAAAAGLSWEPAPWGYGVWPDVASNQGYDLQTNWLWSSLLLTGVVIQGVFSSASQASTSAIRLHTATTGNPNVGLVVSSTTISVTSTNSGGGVTTICSIALGGVPINGPVRVMFIPDGFGGPTSVFLETHDGRTASGVGTGSGTTTHASVNGQVTGACISRASTSFLITSQGNLVNWEPTFFADPSLNALQATPYISNEVAWEVMGEIAETEAGAIWLDESGRLSFKNRNTLTSLSNPIATTVTARDSLKNIFWDYSISQKYTHVSVPYWPVTIRRTVVSAAYILAQKPSNSNVYTMAEMQASLGGATWFVDLDGDAIELDTGIQRFNCAQRIGSYVEIGAADRNDDFRNDCGSPRPPGVPRYSYDKLLGSEGSVTLTVTIFTPSRIMINAVFSPGMLWPYDPDAEVSLAGAGGNGTPGPVMMAKQVNIWGEESTYTAITDDNPPTGQRFLNVPGSRWRSTLAEAQTLGDWLAAELETPRPIITNLPLAVPDPRIQLGDHIRVEDPEISGLSGRCLVVGISLHSTDGQLEQELSVRVLAVD